MSIAPLDQLTTVRRADHVVGPSQGRWTNDDYAAIPDDGQRYEMIKGVLYMAPAPTVPHQRSGVRFSYYLLQHVEIPGLGVVIVAPVDVELAPDIVVQPDVVVILNDNVSIITHKRIIGTPDLVVEIASPGTAGYDRREKQDTYAESGLREYWIADPFARTVEVLTLEGDRYRSLGVFANEQTLPSRVVLMPVKVEQFFP